MCDTYIHRQGMFFWIDDMNEGTGNSVIPKKKRIWLVVSNNHINYTSANLTVVPVYTRDEATKETHVAFKNGERNCVIVCEDIMTVPRSRIHPSNFAGVCSPELWARVHSAIMSQFKDDVNINNVSNTVTAIISNEEFKNTIIDAIVDLFKNQHITTTNIKTTENSPNTDITINTTTNVVSTNKKKHMSAEVSKDWFSDSFTMTLDELNKKYATYGIIENGAKLDRRRKYIKEKLRMLEKNA